MTVFSILDDLHYDQTGGMIDDLIACDLSGSESNIQGIDHYGPVTVSRLCLA
jgi:hypothetical protein